MKRIFRFLGWVVAGLALAVVVGVCGLYLWLRTSVPATDGTTTLPGLSGPAEISRDVNSLVHIRAGSANDAYFALGYAHAQDRLWQMEATRRLGLGRLAVVAGPSLLAQDRLMRTLGIGRLAETALTHLSPEALAGVEAYARGVNAWIDNHSGALPPEFTLLFHAPEPWRPADSMIWGRLMALSLSGSWRRQLTRARMRQQLSTDAIERLYPPDPDDAPVTVRDDRRAETGRTPVAPANDASPANLPHDLLEALHLVLPEAPPAEGASNGWLVTGTRSASGKPLLANDPHLGFRAPNIWYLARIDVPGLTLAGATAPGVPFHVLGHNGRIAWGMTTTGADTQDLIVERLAPGESDRYIAPDGVRNFSTREEIIRVRGSDPVTLTVRESRNGPVVSDLSTDAASAAGPGAVLTLRSTVLAGDDATAEALFRINLATDWGSFTSALALFHAPVQNLFYADVAGQIGFSVAGRIPIRRGRDSYSLADGSREADDWAGFIPPGELPRSHDPARGIIVNANNRVAGPSYPYVISRDWEAPYRAMRIEQKLAETGKQDVSSTQALQLDAVSLAARALVPHLLRLTPRGTDDDALVDLLRAWDGRIDRNRPEGLIFNAWMSHLMGVLFHDELGPVFDNFGRLRPQLLIKALTTDTSWCDDVTTAPERETCPAALALSLGRARADLARAYGPDPSAWRWGAAHRAIFSNPALDWMPFIGPRTRIAIETDGDDFTVNRGTSRLRGDASRFDHAHGATLRAVYDLADLDGTAFAMPGGQSGNPLSRHYSDLTQPWRDGHYVRLPAAPDGPATTLHLLPRPSSPP
ncbi:MAG: penicillin acylase family protein [Alphaproteobacteria bacterium]